MSKNQARDLFQLQAELTDMKVAMEVSKAIDRVIEKINDLKSEIHDLRHEMNERFSALDKRVVAIETRLGMVGEKQKGIYDRFMDYLFKAGWGMLTLVFAYLIAQFHLFIQ